VKLPRASAATAAPATPATEAANAVEIIQPPKGYALPDLGRVWEYRDLVYFLARRDIAVRYRQTLIGAAWAVAQPLAFAAVFSLFVTLIGRPPTAGLPFPVFALAGMTVWLFFSSTLSVVSNSTIASSSLISKVYFPRLVIPIAAVLPPIVDFLVALVVLFLAMAVYGVPPTMNLVALPATFLLAAATALGAGLWLSAIAVRFRDVQLIVPFSVQVGLFLSPVLYQASLVPERFQALYSVNPLVGVLETFRWSLLGTSPRGNLLLISVAVSIVLLVTGLLYFTRAETRCADDL
jgi:lipopolysaccharide transport system permease protein